MRIYMLKRYYEKRKEIIEYLGGKCNVCNSIKKLEIDHINPKEKNFSISKQWNITNEKLYSEIDKCQLLCHSCHLKKSKQENSFSKGWQHHKKLVHGSDWTYKHHKCRCDICIKVNRKRYPLCRKFKNVGEVKHGQRRVYLKGCRCNLCKQANTSYHKQLRNK